MNWTTAVVSSTASHSFALAAAVLIAILVDHFMGEPPLRWHPVVWMGNYLNAVTRYVVPAATASLAPGEIRDLRALTLGTAYWLLGAATIFILFSIVQWVILQLHWALAALLMGLALKPLLAWAMLHREVQAVEAALTQSIEAGRERLSFLVSRNTAQLTESEVRESAIESLAENLNDSVVAPIFWFVLFGLPGAAVYRFANTADAMWGYKGLRNGVNWEWAGKWAARADDVLSWLPARITALLLLLVAGGLNVKVLVLEARKTPSPNSGWPMAAMALALGVRLQKSGVYILNAAGRPPEPEDAVLARKKSSKVVLASIIAAQAAIILIAFLKS